MEENTGVEICCSICLEGEAEGELLRLKCSHTFHPACLKQVRNPHCPNCRAPITELDEEDVRMMKKRQREDKNEDNLNTAVALGFITRVPFHRRDVLRSLLQRFPIEMIVSYQSAKLFADAYHDWAHPLMRNEPFSCDVLKKFAHEIYDCLLPSKPRDICRIETTTLLPWFSARVSISGMTDALHTISHMAFLTTDCNVLHYHEISAARILLGEALLISALRRE